VSDLLPTPQDFNVPANIPGLVTGIDDLATSFDRIARQAATAADQLGSGAQSLQWTGLAAQKFESAIGSLPSLLNQVSSSYGTAGNALSSYADSISGYQSQYTQARERLAELAQRAESLRNQHASAQQSGQDASGIDSQARALLSEIGQELNQMARIWSDACDIASQLMSSINQAYSEGNMNTFVGGVERWGGDAVGVVLDVGGDILGFVAKTLEGLLKDLVDLAESLVKLEAAYLKLLEDLATGNWSDAGKQLAAMATDLDHIAKDLNAILGTLAPLLQLIPGLGEIVDIVLLVTAVYMLAYDVATGASGWTLAFDVFNVVGDAGSVGGDLADDAATDAIREDVTSDAVSSFRSDTEDELASTERSMSAEKGWITRSLNSGNLDTAESAAAKFTALSDKADSLTHDLSLSDDDIGDLASVKQSIQATMKTKVINPSVFNHLGLNVSLKQLHLVDAGIATSSTIGSSVLTKMDQGDVDDSYVGATGSDIQTVQGVL
jgi:uncharacterized protein YukE